MSVVREQIVKRFTRASGWSRIRKEHIEQNGKCSACATKNGLEVHHIKPVHTHPELELSPGNLVTLCRRCHFCFGHLYYWKSWDEQVVTSAHLFLNRILKRP